MKNEKNFLRFILIVTKNWKKMLINKYDNNMSNLKNILQIMCETMWKKNAAKLTQIFENWYLKKKIEIKSKITCNHIIVFKNKIVVCLQYEMGQFLPDSIGSVLVWFHIESVSTWIDFKLNRFQLESIWFGLDSLSPISQLPPGASIVTRFLSGKFHDFSCL